MGSLIVSGCSTSMVGALQDEVFYMLSFKAARCTLDKVGLNHGDLDFIILASYDALDGRMISNMYAGMASGGFLKYESRIPEDGTLALAYADALISGNMVDLGLVVGYSALESDISTVSLYSLDPFIYRPIGLNHIIQWALFNSSYINMSKMDFGEWESLASHIVSLNRSAGARNPRAHLREGISPDEVMKSRFVVWPLRELHIAPETRGAVALLLASREASRKYMLDEAVEIASVRWYTESYYITYDKLASPIPSLVKAARDAFKEAKIDDVKVIDLYEISDVTPAHYLAVLESLGIAPPGRAREALMKGDIGPDASIIVNRSGGSISTNPYPASGLYKVYEAYLQLTNNAGPLQVEGARVALVHGYTYIAGLAGQAHSIVILKGSV